MLKAFIIKLVVLLVPATALAQYSEVGVFGGASNFLGDVGPYGVYPPQGYAAGAFYRYNFNRHWSVRGGGNYGFIQADDANAVLDYRVHRNLSFQSEIYEAYLQVEFNYFQYEPGSKYWHTPFLSAGFGVFWFEPMTRFEGEMVALQPLGTEGQGTSANSKAPYALANSFFTFGLGYRFSIGRNVTLAIESTFRNTQTDYLDDVSGFYADPEILREENGLLSVALADRSLSGGEKLNRYRGNPDNNDWYIFTGVTLQVRFEDLYEKCTNLLQKPR